MTYISKNARFTILDDIPADVWEEPEDTDPRTATSDPDRYLCIVGDEPADYHGNFTVCIYSAALYQREHTAASAEYLRDRCSLADEATARKIIAHYLRHWATMEDEDAAELLRDAAEEIAHA